MVALKLTELDFFQVKKNLVAFLKADNRFSGFDFEGSNLSILIDLLTYNTIYNGFYSNMVANEMFLDSAILRESVVSRAKAISYTPRSTRSSRSLVQVKFENLVSPPPQIVVPKGSKFSARLDDVVYDFSTTSTIIVSPNIDLDYIGVFELVEGKQLTHRFTYDSTLPDKQRFIIPNSEVDTTTITVKVQDSISSSVINNYTLVDDINLLTSESKVYFLQETDDGNFEVYFGDGVVGKKLEDGNIIIIDYVVSSGTASNKIKQFRPTQALGGFSDLTVTTLSESAGGIERETINSIKLLAPLNYEAQNRAVTRNDYETLIKKDFPAIEFVRVWGGEDNDPPQYGRVFASLKPLTGLSLSTLQKQQIVEGVIRPRNIISIEVVIVEPEYLRLVVDSEVNFKSRLTTLSAGDIEDKSVQAIQQFRLDNLIGFDSFFRYSNLVKAIDAADPSIQNNQTQIKMKYRLEPPLSVPTKYIINFNNPIDRGDFTNRRSAINSSGFIFRNLVTYIGDNGAGDLYYYRLVNNQRVIIQNKVGTVDYNTGKVIINALTVNGIPNNLDYVDIIAEPARLDILPLRNQILLLEDEDINVTVVDERR